GGRQFVGVGLPVAGVAAVDVYARRARHRRHGHDVADDDVVVPPRRRRHGTDDAVDIGAAYAGVGADEPAERRAENARRGALGPRARQRLVAGLGLADEKRKVVAAAASVGITGIGRRRVLVDARRRVLDADDDDLGDAAVLGGGVERLVDLPLVAAERQRRIE